MSAILLAAVLISTIAGNGTPGYSDTQINNAYGLAIGPDGALYICEIGNHVVRRLDLKSRKLTTVAGNGTAGYSGDGGAATSASLNEPYEIAFDNNGNIYFVEMKNNIVRRVDRKTGTISTVPGSVEAGMKQPHSIAFDKEGRLLVCDIGNNRILRIDTKTGAMETIFTGTKDTRTNGPRAIAVGPAGDLYVAFREGNSVYRVDSKTRELTHLAGTGDKGYSGDGGLATKARLSGPKGISLGQGNVYIADTESHTIRRISLSKGIIETVAGTGERGDGPDGDPAQCKMSRPHGVHVDKSGIIYIGDSEAHRVRMVK